MTTTVSAKLYTELSDAYSKLEADYEALKASAPSPFGPQVWSKEAEMRKSWEKIGAPDAPAGDKLDAARYRWLCEDIEDVDEHVSRNKLLDRMAAMTYSAISRDIDAARAASAGANKTVIRENRATAPAGHAEPVGFDAWWAANFHGKNGADYRHWAKEGWLAAPVAAEPAPTNGKGTES